MNDIKAYAAQSAAAELAPFAIQRRELRADDVALEILYCGVCHTDVHLVDNDWGVSKYPMVPGHEIVGRVSAVGSAVTKHRVGDLVGVGYMGDACRSCSACHSGLEQFCAQMVPTFNGTDLHDKSNTLGGYAERIVVSDRFVVSVPDGLDPAAAAPLLCAGITSYSPLRRFGVQPGMRVGVLGMGGLGHIGVKFAKALGAEVTIFTRSQAKVEEAQSQGADHVIVSSDRAQMRQASERFDLLLNTIPVQHDVNPYLFCLKYDGTMVMVGVLEPLVPPVHAALLTMRRRTLVGSSVGGMAETQEMLDFCAKHDIVCDVELIGIQDINAAYERMKRGAVKYRFVVDMATLKA